MQSTTSAGLWRSSSAPSVERRTTSSVSSPSRSSSSSARLSGSASTSSRGRSFNGSGRKMLPHSATTRVPSGTPAASSSATAPSASSRRSALMMTVRGPSSSTRRATAIPTSPDPPRSNTVFPWISILRRFLQRFVHQPGAGPGRRRRTPSVLAPAGQPIERRDLGGGETPPRARRQTAEPHRAMTQPHKAAYGMARRSHHAPDDPFPAVPHRDPQARDSRRGSTPALDGTRPRRPVLELDAPQQPSLRRRRDAAFHVHLVHPVHPV